MICFVFFSFDRQALIDVTKYHDTLDISRIDICKKIHHHQQNILWHYLSPLILFNSFYGTTLFTFHDEIHHLIILNLN